MSDSTCKNDTWPIQQAQKLLEFWDKNPSEDGICRFETGYSPSGLPHIGTFCELKRIFWVINAFKELCDVPVELICFSDDLDGLRSVPENLPNQEMLKKYLGCSLTSIPDPFEKTSSLGEYMNGKMMSFLQTFNVNCTFYSSTKCYQSGMLDEYLIKTLEKYDDIMNIMLPSLREQRRKTYSPFLPICPETKQVLEVPIIDKCLKKHTISYIHPNTKQLCITPVTGGRCKLQWKPDFGMRWAALNVKYEMYGKDHASNGHIYSRICNALGKQAPVQYVYELFLDDKGQKISKSKGNSISLDTLIYYFPREAIELTIYDNPNRAKKLSFEVMIRNTDRYVSYYKDYHTLSESEKKQNPLYHIHNGKVPNHYFGILSFSLIIYLVSVFDGESLESIKNIITRYDNKVDLSDTSYCKKLIDHAIKYYKDLLAPTNQYIKPTEDQKKDLLSVIEYVDGLDVIDPDIIQKYMYKLARESKIDPMSKYFEGLYSVLIGRKNGPRLGSLFAMLNKEGTKKFIHKILQN